MRLNKVYNVVVNDIIVATSNSYNAIIRQFEEIRKSEPKAWLQTCFC